MPMPQDKKMADREETANQKIREKTIKEGLSEIYQGDDGEIIDVKKLNLKPKRKWWFWFIIIFSYALALGIVGVLAWYYLNNSTDAEAVDIEIMSEKKIITGKEFYYTIKYNNLERVGLNNILIRAEYPENFIFLESSPQANKDDNVWEIKNLGPHRGGEIKIKGKIIAAKDKQSIILAEMTYQPENFTSEFKKVISFDQLIVDTGLDLEIVNPANAIINEEQRLTIKYKAKKEGYLDNFRLTVIPSDKDNIKLLGPKENSDKITAVDPWVWQIDGINKKEAEIKIRFKFLDKVSSASQNLQLKFEYKYDPNQGLDENKPAPEAEVLGVSYYLFQTEKVDINVVKNNLNLNLIINGSDQNQNVNFGQTLNYSINYSNKENYDVEDLMIMAVLDGQLLDWDSLQQKVNGLQKDNTITWTKDELPALALLPSNSSGSIDFSIKIKTPEQARKDKDYQGNNTLKSYIQFKTLLDENDKETETSSNLSNVIVNQVNSDLQLKEKVIYFNDDNIAVGNGPLPPKVGETTSLRVIWQIDNTMNDLVNLQVVAELPDYITWAGRDQASLGRLTYKQSTNQVVWDIDSLPASFNQPRAEFNISLTPDETNRNQIMVLLPGTKIIAKDVVTNDQIKKTNNAKTTRLEDDNMINSDGVVQ